MSTYIQRAIRRRERTGRWPYNLHRQAPNTRTLEPTLSGTLRYTYSQGKRQLIDVATGEPADLVTGDILIVSNLPPRFQRAWQLRSDTIKVVFLARNGGVFAIQSKSSVDRHREIPLRQMHHKAELLLQGKDFRYC